MHRQFIKIVSVLCLIVLVGCAGHGPVEINYGQDPCDYCKMTIADNKFGSELVSSKGKIYRFDSIECLAAYAQVNTGENASVKSMWVTDYSNAGTFVRVDSATIILSANKNSPMGVGLVAFSSGPEAGIFAHENAGQLLTWPKIIKIVAQVWKL